MVMLMHTIIVASIRSKDAVANWNEVDVSFDVHAASEWITVHFDILRVHAVAVVAVANCLIVLVPAIDSANIRAEHDL